MRPFLPSPGMISQATFEVGSVKRSISQVWVIIKPTWYKQFTWQRYYGLNYDLSKSFHIQYTANANARIDEPIGRIDTPSAGD